MSEFRVIAGELSAVCVKLLNAVCVPSGQRGCLHAFQFRNVARGDHGVCGLRTLIKASRQEAPRGHIQRRSLRNPRSFPRMATGGLQTRRERLSLARVYTLHETLFLARSFYLDAMGQCGVALVTVPADSKSKEWLSRRGDRISQDPRPVRVRAAKDGTIITYLSAHAMTFFIGASPSDLAI